MLRLRCYVFANLVRDTVNRELTRDELQFLTSHRAECVKCQLREDISKCSLEAVRSIDDEQEEGAGAKTGSILDNLGFNFLKH
jgi:hypothetical protein